MRTLFPDCDGMIGVAAPCDYRPEKIAPHKIAKTGEPLQIKLMETDDIVAQLGKCKGNRWVVGFALETEDPRLRALVKLEKKSCDLMVLNGVDAMHAKTNSVEILEPSGKSIGAFEGEKRNGGQADFRRHRAATHRQPQGLGLRRHNTLVNRPVKQVKKVT